jgi:hypothetical protein
MSKILKSALALSIGGALAMQTLIASAAPWDSFASSHSPKSALEGQPDE